MDLFLLDCPTYDDYLDTFVTKNDVRYVRNVRFCRMLVELGYRSSTEVYNPEQFESHKVAAHEALWPTIKATVFFSENIKIKDPVLQQLALRERPNVQKMISVKKYARSPISLPPQTFRSFIQIFIECHRLL